MTEFKFYPAVVVWEITFACSMRCLHCGTSAGKKRPDELTTEESLALIDELADLEAFNITLSGGEPLLRPDWRQLAERIKKRGVTSAVITNGYAVSKDIVEDFQRLDINKVAVSFDGTEKTHNYIRQRDDSWQRAFNAMALMAENGNVPFSAISQISNMNLHEMDDIKESLIKAGCTSWRIQMTTSTGRMKSQKDLVLSLDNFPKLIDKIIEIKKEGRIEVDVGENIGYYGCKGYELWNNEPYFGCYAGMRIAGIESNGNVKGCLSMPEEFIEGNIRDSSFTEIWNNPNGFAYNRQFTRDTASGQCHDCRYLPICRGGCTTTSISSTGQRADNPYCIYRVEQARGDAPCEDIPFVTETLKRFESAMKNEEVAK